MNFRVQVIKDYQLYIVVGVLLSIDIAIMTTWQIVDPFYRETKQLGQYVSSQTLWEAACELWGRGEGGHGGVSVQGTVSCNDTAGCGIIVTRATQPFRHPHGVTFGEQLAPFQQRELCLC